MSETSKRSTFEWATQIIVPVVAAIATVFQQQRAVALGLVTLAVLSLLMSGVPKMQGAFNAWRLRRREHLISALALEDLRSRVHRFEDFVNTRTNDTLYSIVFSRLCQSHSGHYEALQLAPVMFFSEVWEQLRNRSDRRKPSFDALRDSVLEFNSLVAGFCRYFVCPVYERIPSTLSPEQLKVYNYQGVQRDLIQFRERFDRFLCDYQDFLRDLDRKLPRSGQLGYYFEHPKPLVAATVPVLATETPTAMEG